MPGRRSVGYVSSKVTFLCGVVCFITCLRGWLNSFRLAFISVTGFVVVVVVIVLAAWDRVIGATFSISESFFGVFSLFFCFFSKRH